MSSEDPREREDLCGRELVSEDRLEKLDEEYDPSTWHEAGDGGHYCCREVWDGARGGRCIWHADVADKPPDELMASLSERPARLDRAVLRSIASAGGLVFVGCRLHEADLSDAGLGAADFESADLVNADFGGANLVDAYLGDANLGGADLNDAVLFGANLSGADLFGADLIDADLRHANLDEAKFPGADLNSADLRYADFGGADLGGADLTACAFHQTSFENATFDEGTVFGTSSSYEIDADDTAEAESWLATYVSTRLSALGRLSAGSQPLERAETQYRTIQRLKRENDLKQDPELEIREKHARRKRALAERCYWDWFKLAFYRWPMGYGEKPTHVVATSIAVIFAAMLAYPHAGGFERTTGATTAVADLSQALSVPEAVTSAVGPWLTSFYFSVVTFTTVGYGDLRPATEMGRLLASVESFLGALLMALLVFVLGRRATW